VLCSFSIAKYGPQTDNDAQFHPDCGNGIKSNGPPPVFVVNNPLDANTPNSVALEHTFVQHLVNTFGTSANGGVRYYILDNVYGSWHETHRDVHPVGATYDEMKQKMVSYATMIKSVDPGALVVGPEEFGWFGYLFSGRDLRLCDQGNCSSPDRTAHGNQEFVAFLLSQMQAASVTAGQRLLDVFTLHYYPQGNGVFEDLTDPATQDLRSRSTRSLWDPTYVDESFINEIIRLIPRMKDWVAANDPGTPLGVTEYIFIYRFNPMVELITIQTALARPSFGDLAARPLGPVAVESVVIFRRGPAAPADRHLPMARGAVFGRLDRSQHCRGRAVSI
jgi:hypothetical protein